MPVGFSGTNNCANVEPRVALDTRNGHWSLTEDRMFSELRRKPIVPVRNLGVLWPAPKLLVGCARPGICRVKSWTSRWSRLRRDSRL